ncbi:hypothetical protein TrLO_g10667 [Triparma laevis f. longispina]|uniref:Polycystin cation channel PKD1/PKD2 domain-containing protein n=1 Tax=Triparma laevis f. longispina TaxID=1714387 RepID=A0A9W7A5F2_9STRA|nr:hypothetical protein TrLO_g10667 [Triparma laevis f. longispina]
MTETDRILLQPWEKYRKFSKFPFKFALHSLLVVLVTAQVAVFNVQDALYSRTMHKGFKFFLMPEGFDRDVAPQEMTLYNLNDTMAALQKVSNGFWEMPERAIATVGFVDSNDNLMCHVPSVLTSNASDPNYFRPNEPRVDIYTSPDSHTLTMNSYRLQPIPDFPVGATIPQFNSTGTLRALMEDLDHIDFVMNVCNENLGYLYRSCYVWSVTVTFDFQNYANIVVSVHDDIVGKCDGPDVNEYLSKTTHNVGIVVVAFVYSLLVIKEFLSKLKTFRNVKNTHALASRIYASQNEAGGLTDSSLFTGQEGATAEKIIQIPWSKVPLSVRLRFFSVWLPLTFLGLATCMIYSFMILSKSSYHIPTSVTEKLLCGLSCMLVWLTWIQFYKHNKRYYSFVLTMSHALPLLIPFLIGVTPIFLGYAMFGLSYFGSQVMWFQLPEGTFKLLFSVLNGDVVYQTFVSMWQPNGAVVNIYWVTFIVVFMYGVLNVTISVIEHSYFSSQGEVRTFDMFIRRGFSGTSWEDSQKEEEKGGIDFTFFDGVEMRGGEADLDVAIRTRVLGDETTSGGGGLGTSPRKRLSGGYGSDDGSDTGGLYRSSPRRARGGGGGLTGSTGGGGVRKPGLTLFEEACLLYVLKDEIEEEKKRATT